MRRRTMPMESSEQNDRKMMRRTMAMESSEQNDEEELLPPLSPVSQSFNSSVLDLIIVNVFELETPITESEVLTFLRNEFVPMSQRFSSIKVNDKKGVARWKKVGIQVEDHLIIHTFPLGGSKSSRECFDEYLSKVGCESFPENKPLWEVHFIKEPSVNGATSLVLKMSHAIGDGYSFARLAFFAMKRADNPSLPLTIPQMLLRSNEAEKGMNYYLGIVSKCLNTVSDLSWNMLKATVMKDQPTAIRSEETHSELIRPVNVSCITLCLDRVKQVKSRLGATVTDVLMGVVSYVIHLYMVRMNQISNSSMTMLVSVNMRALKGYKNLDEMVKSDTWGNNSRTIPVPMPSPAFTDPKKVNPLDFITKASQIMKRKKNSYSFYLIDPVLKLVRSTKGQQGLNEFVHLGAKNASTLITSLIGPKEQMALMEHPISSFYYFITGLPQSLTFTSMSCNNQLKLVAIMEKGFIDSKVLTSCMNDAFENIFEAAFALDAVKNATKSI